MMDPLTAIGLASNVVQFITFASDLVSKGRVIYKSADGQLVETLELSEITEILQAEIEVDHISTGGRLATKTDKQLEELCNGCRGVSTDLLRAIDALKFNGRHRKWNSFRQALQSIWKEEEIQSLTMRLERYRSQIDTTLLFSLREVVLQQGHGFARFRETLNKDMAKFMDESREWQADILRSIRQNQDPTISLFQLLAAGKRPGEQSIEERIRENLWFREMKSRHEGISEAHEQTFDWIFTHGETTPDDILPKSSGCSEITNVRWDNFAEWLRSEKSFYWITGKPGSGKSTLMKYLFNDNRTREHLDPWRGDSPLKTAGFFFWNSGTQMQMSQEALMRTLLYHLTDGQNEDIPRLFPYRWQRSQLFGDYDHPWTLSELIKAFEILMSDTSTRFLLFVDGLDEFDVDCEKLAAFLLGASQRPNVKVCAASRPWNVFEDAFGRRPSLKMEHLTARDIRLVVSDRLHTSLKFVEMNRIHPEDCRSLIEEVCKKANGVFLWVHLVVKSLLEGLRDGDSIARLRDRLVSIPGDLEGFFKKILHDMSPSKAEEASKQFQLMEAAVFPLSLLLFSFAGDGFDNAMSAEVKPMSLEEKQFRADTTNRRLRSCTKGLLEANDPAGQDPDSEVNYLHRTVRDFITRREFWASILGSVKGN
ncbi:uncharacterized protein K452DRAFT_211711, partial [Aplosporella prunicola CBS 121167]